MSRRRRSRSRDHADERRYPEGEAHLHIPPPSDEPGLISLHPPKDGKLAYRAPVPLEGFRDYSSAGAGAPNFPIRPPYVINDEEDE